MKKYGFTFIELIIFIAIIGIVASTVLLALNRTVQYAPYLYQQNAATHVAAKCAEWYLGQRYRNGYSSIALGSTVPAFCTTPSGYTIATNVTQTTIGSDSNFKTITISVEGRGNASLSLLMADY